jgi:hypothetical protein
MLCGKQLYYIAQACTIIQNMKFPKNTRSVDFNCSVRNSIPFQLVRHALQWRRLEYDKTRRPRRCSFSLSQGNGKYAFRLPLTRSGDIKLMFHPYSGPIVCGIHRQPQSPIGRYRSILALDMSLDHLQERSLHPTTFVFFVILVMRSISTKVCMAYEYGWSVAPL